MAARAGSIENDVKPSMGPWAEKTVLTMDGGGVRGFASLLILQRLMRMVGDAERNQRPKHLSSFQHGELPDTANGGASSSSDSKLQGKPGLQNLGTETYLPCHYFDYMFGTSTGGLNAIMLGRLRMSIDECVQLYPDLARNVFGNRKRFTMGGILRYKHNPKYLEAEIDKLVKSKTPPTGDSARFKQMRSPSDLCKVAVISNRVNLNEGGSEQPYAFRTYPVPDERASVEAIVNVARATTAAAPYLPPITIDNHTHTDGAIGTNNPVSWAVMEVRGLERSLSGGRLSSPYIRMMVGIGTGNKRLLRKKERFLFKVTHRTFRSVVNVATGSEAAHAAAANLMQVLGRPYERFDGGDELARLELDNWDEDFIRQCVNKYLKDEDVLARLKAAAEILVQQRRDRQEEDLRRWKRFTHCIRFGCPKCSITHKDWNMMRYHLREPPENHSALRGATEAYIESLLNENERQPESNFGPI